MWVSTTGEDSPQCIHDTLRNDQGPHAQHQNKSCRSLNHALSHMMNDTRIVISCGEHILRPLSSPPLSNIKHVKIEGDCSHELAQINCAEGANLIFHNIGRVQIFNLAFINCGKQLQSSDSFFKSSTLLFQDVAVVRIGAVFVHIAGPHGTGIAFTKRETTTTQLQGLVAIENTVIVHSGFHGSGIHLEFLMKKGENDSHADEIIELENVHILGANDHPMASEGPVFTGINITVQGDGQGEIILSHVFVNKTTDGSGIAVALLDRVHDFTVLFKDVAIREKWKNGQNYSMMAASDFTYYEHSSNISQKATNISTPYSSIKIELGDNSKENDILIVGVIIMERRGISPGSAFSIEVTNRSEGNNILVQGLQLQQVAGSSSSGAYRRGLQVILTGKARRNQILVVHLQSVFHRGYWGSGAYVEFSGYATMNFVALINSHTFAIHAFIGGGGIAVVCKDMATQNVLKSVNKSIAEISSPIFGKAQMHDYTSNTTKGSAGNSTTCSSINIELRDNSKGNWMLIQNVSVLARSGATSGSAFSIEATDHSEGNTIQLQDIVLQQSMASSIVRAHRRGLQVILTGKARRNEISVVGLVSFFHKAYYGGGAYVEFSGNSTGNLALLNDSQFQANHAFMGGGIAALFKDFTSQNVFKTNNVTVKNSSAELGGGVYLILQDSSNNNTIHLTNMKVLNNTAYCGGGIFISFRNATVASKVEILGDIVYNNTLLPSETHDMLGGGVHVEFSTVSATFRTDNIISFMLCGVLHNTAEEGVGGGISVLYKHSRYQGDSGDRVTVDNVIMLQNKAISGSACAFQSLPTHGKRLFRGVRIAHNTVVLLDTAEFQTMPYKQVLASVDQPKFEGYNISDYMNMSEALIQEQQSKPANTFFEVRNNTNLVFIKSVRVTAENLGILCGASSQGLYALDSEIVLQPNTQSLFAHCVATHGGAIALYGESHIRVTRNVTLDFMGNHAFQRGGAIYVSSAPGVVPVSDCFLQYHQEREENSGVFAFWDNSAKAEGQSAYVSDIRNCLYYRKQASKNFTANITRNTSPHNNKTSFSQYDVLCFNFTFIHTKNGPSNDSELMKRMKQQVMAGPSHVGPVDPTDLEKPQTIQFIPGIQEQLPYTHAYDEFGNNISSVFTVLINKIDDSIPVELDTFSKFTADFTVILRGIPKQHGMANYSYHIPQVNHTINISNETAPVRPPQLVLQSVDNKDLLLVMNIELQCCPPGYIYRYETGDMGGCLCGMLDVPGIVECRETNNKSVGAVLERDYWAGYLTSNDQHSCDEQKFFTGPCPPGYCQTQQIILPQNNSKQGLQDVVCAGSDRKGLLCGDCLEGKGIAVNFNGIRPVCTSCEEGLSKVGILIWILSEWVPMLAFMFVLMLFNIDLVSGRFNAFLLFAQLLSFSTIRGDAELGPVHNAFVRIYRFLYGMWNLDFFGVLLPPFCLAPNANLTLLQTLLLHYSIGLFPLAVAITLTVLERSAEKWICCHRVDQCLRRMRRWKAKYSDGMSYDRALPAFVILGFTRFLVSSSYILVNQTIAGEDEKGKVVVWWQGSVPYGSIQHIAYFIPAIIILLVFVLLPSFLLLTLPIVPQLFGRLIIAVPPLRKLQRIQTFCSNVYTDRWVYHFVNVYQGCYKERYRSFSSLYLFHRIVHLLVAVFIPKTEDALRIQIILTVALLMLIAVCHPYNSLKLNTLDSAILGNLALILILSLHITDLNTPIGVKHFYASVQMILIYLTLLYPSILLGKKLYLKCKQLRCYQKQEKEEREDIAEPLLEAPAERLGNFALITELHAGKPTSEDDDETVTGNESQTT